MSENITMTRISDLPDPGQQMAIGQMGLNGSAQLGRGASSMDNTFISQQMGQGPGPGQGGQMAADMYMPMNVHPNPYGIPKPPIGGMAPPQQTQTGPTQYPSSSYSSNVNMPNTNNSLSLEQMAMFESMPQQRLPPRDIPSDLRMDERLHDEEIVANYIPKPKLSNDYIKEFQDISDRKIREYEEQKHREKMASHWFDDLQAPILIAILFFIFCLPIVNTVIFKRFAFLSIYKEDGNFNLIGLTLKSFMFGSLYYSISKTMKFISEF